MHALARSPVSPPSVAVLPARATRLLHSGLKLLDCAEAVEQMRSEFFCQQVLPLRCKQLPSCTVSLLVIRRVAAAFSSVCLCTVLRLLC